MLQDTPNKIKTAATTTTTTTTDSNAAVTAVAPSVPNRGANATVYEMDSPDTLEEV